MFGLLHYFSHISKDVAYGVNNVSSSLYLFFISIVEGTQWMVTPNYYKIVGDNKANNLKEIILMFRMTTSIVNVTPFHKQEGDDMDICLQLLKSLPSFVLIDLFYFVSKRRGPLCQGIQHSCLTKLGLFHYNEDH
jgi:hypothetical protein